MQKGSHLDSPSRMFIQRNLAKIKLEVVMDKYTSIDSYTDKFTLQDAARRLAYIADEVGDSDSMQEVVTLAQLFLDLDCQTEGTLIRYDEMEEFARERAESLNGSVDFDTWPFHLIDWEEAGDELDSTDTVYVDGVEFRFFAADE